VKRVIAIFVFGLLVTPLPIFANSCDPPKRIRVKSNCGIAVGRPKMRIELIDQNGHFGDMAETDSQGMFQFTHAKAGKYTLRAEAPGSDILLTPIYLSLEESGNCELVLIVHQDTGMGCLTYAYLSAKDFKKYKQDEQAHAQTH
jgi:hypothetical protein